MKRKTQKKRITGTGIAGRRNAAETLEIFLVGDLCLLGAAGEAVLAGGTKEMAACLVEPMRGVDFRIVNFEAALTRSQAPIVKSGPNLKVDPGTAVFLKEAGFNVAALANNHVGDFGPEAVLETVSALESQGIRTVGAGANIAEARKPLFLEKGGVRAALLNRAENEFGTASEDRAGAAGLSVLEDLEAVRAAAAQTDFTVVLAHGGAETAPFPTPETVKLFRAFVDAGAAAVIGAHTHCPQGMELYKGKPVFYSLGNFLFGGLAGRVYDKGDFWWTGYGVRLVFRRGGATMARVTPFHLGPDGALLRRLDMEEEAGFFKYLDAVSEPLKNPAEMVALYEAWSVIHGPDWLARLQFAKWPLADETDYRNIMHVRNSFTCEAHRELNTVFLRLIEEKRVEKAAALIPRIKELQRATFIKA